MTEEQGIGPILLADCGTLTTKVVLLDRVDGEYRFVARGESPTTVEQPWADIAAGVRSAIEQISEVTGRTLLDDSGELITPSKSGDVGVDAFAATVSAAPPLRVVLGGLVGDLSVASARRAAAGTYSQLVAVLSSDGKRGLSDQERVSLIRQAGPDVVCVVGGIEGGAARPVLDLVEVATWAMLLLESERLPCMLYAGNSRLRKRVAELVDGQFELRVADNVRPSVSQETLIGAEIELDSLYVQDKLSALPGIGAVSGWSSVPLMPTARAFGRVVEYLWHLGDPKHGAVGLDLGAGNLTLATVFDGELSLCVRSDLGIAYCGDYLLESRGFDAISRWVPVPVSEADVRGFCINREIHPATIPQDPLELWLELALAREAVGMALEEARPSGRSAERGASGVRQMRPCDTILLSGGVLAHAARPGQAVLVVLDALQPVGISTMVVDAHGLAPALGNVVSIKPLAAVETLDHDGFVNLATVVTPIGEARHGDTVLKVRVTYDDGSSFGVEVRYGDLEVLPLLPGHQADLELKPLRRFDAGFGPGKSGKRRVNGGEVGLVIDARGRPLVLPTDAKKRQETMQRWLWDVGG
ncbi:MAG: hypothetical protein GX620_01650 [Chloroflexi bacterium]|nr:hypothetical protein [Chloroflexota bacterium]